MLLQLLLDHGCASIIFLELLSKLLQQLPLAVCLLSVYFVGLVQGFYLISKNRSARVVLLFKHVFKSLHQLLPAARWQHTRCYVLALASERHDIISQSRLVLAVKFLLRRCHASYLLLDHVVDLAQRLYLLLTCCSARVILGSKHRFNLLFQLLPAAHAQRACRDVTTLASERSDYLYHLLLEQGGASVIFPLEMFFDFQR